MSTDATREAALQAVSTGGEAMIGLAALGKTALVLALLVGMIVLFGWLVRRLGPGQGQDTRLLRVVASKAVGAKERVVVVDVDGTRLVLGVGGGRVTRLHESTAPPTAPPDEMARSERFATRFAEALKQNLGGGRS
ncbi:flagellar biosynthetic protein FliO [Alloalcanivorax sp. C16-2]|uniref:flagellar biosynthetic protein FliO n=1 Tax=Alloalcanivorax TaxID=3020832 RepID=UPI001933F51B|nr:flagellar biosynthetic protein FliO [Alloalcanivorax marinus]MBL7251715.1 flagellar biosynthetic protein FliO [Alloalcanivorax marinus]